MDLQLFLTTSAIIWSYHAVASFTTFVVSFQNSGGWSTNEWVEIDKPIPVLNEFTACHWEKIRYFSSEIMTVWSYCIARRDLKSDLECTQLYTSGNETTTNQQLILSGWINGYEFSVNIEEYRHRTWNHICWSYSRQSLLNKFYYNGKLIGIKPMSEVVTIPTADQSKMASFILGQEPDIFNGEFEVTQVFNGEISELNLWGSVLTDDEILSLGNCQNISKDWESSLLLSWEKKWIKNHGSFIEDNFNTDNFCKTHERFIVFARRQPHDIAIDLCTSHGGQLITPNSLEENEKMMNLMNDHRDTCIEENPTNPANTGKAVWIGLVRENFIWYSLNAEGNKSQPTFTNLGNKANSNYYSNIDCSYAVDGGKWDFTTEASCVNLELCTICKVIGNPVFTVNGFCYQNVFDFNYYFATDEKNAISYYEGYKSTNIVKLNNSWNFVSKHGVVANARILYNFETDYSFPVGRKEWSMYDPKCKVIKEQKELISISKCRFGEQFTCNSGNCIDLEKRCNQVIDCSDASDEDGCKLILVPNNYRNVQPPEPINNTEPLNIVTFITIESIDSIDTIDMQVGLTLTINMKWKDTRLTFANLIPNSDNRVTPETANTLWIPLEYVTHDNAMIGEIHQDSNKEVEIHVLKPPSPMNSDNAIQDTLYDGAENVIDFKQRYRVLYKCPFFLQYFPFDTQTCTFIMHMEISKIHAVVFQKNTPAIKYVGPKLVKEFKIEDVSAFAGVTSGLDKYTYFNFTVKFDRMYADQIISTFFPTLLLWMLAYATIFIKIEYFNERICVSVTVLLVLAALLTSIKDRIPPTSYFKYIDLWFLWYTAYIFSITIFHIILHTFTEKAERNKVTVGVQMTRVDNINDESSYRNVNNMAKILIFLPFILFNCIYFTVQFSN